MNKQALAFLTMFSLILMLSVYYVTLPNDSAKTVVKDETPKSSKADSSNTKKTDSNKEDAKEQGDVKSDTSKTSEVSKLQESINQKKEVEINKNNDIIANDKSDEKAKKDALTNIDNLKQQQTLQKAVVDALAEDGYKSAVEINNSTCIVNIFEQTDEKELAKKILTKTSSLTNNKYLIEVSFK